MNRIKAIAFDLGGVLLTENDFALSEIQSIIEKAFGNIDMLDKFINFVQTETNLSKTDVLYEIEFIIENIYELREKNILDVFSDYKLAVATNHLPQIKNFFKKYDLDSYFCCIVVSGDIGYSKPDKKFYLKLIDTIGEKPENILFIDDNIEYIESARKCGLQTLHYHRTHGNLINIIQDYIALNMQQN